MAGHASIDQYFWQGMMLSTIVITHDHQLVGVAGYGTKEQDGYLIWLHAHEDKAIIQVLVQAVLRKLRACQRILAFWFATPLTLGVEGLPISHRPVTHQVLCEAGFVGEDCWLYMGGNPASQEGEDIAQVEHTGQDWKLSVRAGEAVIAEAQVSLVDTIGVVWWLFVDEQQRGKGLGKSLFRQALRILHEVGAETIILYVDHDDPIERDRRPAITLYRAHGFQVIDHLWSCWRGMPPE